MDLHLYEAFHRLERSHWWFIARQRILLDLTRRFVAPGGRILDVGCGTGYFLDEARHEFEVHGVDPSETAARMCRDRGLTSFTVGTVEDVGGSQTSPFDAVMFLDVIEHMDDDVGALRAANRLMAPGGVTVVTVPAYKFLWSEHDDANQHRRRYVASGLAAALRNAGFQVELVTYFNTFLFPLAVARRLAQRVFPSKAYDELALPAPWVNQWCRRVFELEAPLVKRAGSRGLLPFGLSIAAVGRATGVRLPNDLAETLPRSLHGSLAR